jgi:hypothetical protein
LVLNFESIDLFIDLPDQFEIALCDGTAPLLEQADQLIVVKCEGGHGHFYLFLLWL